MFLGIFFFFNLYLKALLNERILIMWQMFNFMRFNIFFPFFVLQNQLDLIHTFCFTGSFLLFLEKRKGKQLKSH